MSKMKRILLFSSMLLILGLGVVFYIRPEEEMDNASDVLRIGAGDDITGLLLEKIIEIEDDGIEMENVDSGTEEESTLFNFTFKDC